jgi:hypothetical protein
VVISPSPLHGASAATEAAGQSGIERWFAARYDRQNAPAERRRLAALRRHLVGDLSGDVLEIAAELALAALVNDACQGGSVRSGALR